jgi:signal transduction histidine kinase
MDARTETTAVSPAPSPRSLIEHAEIRSILSSLSHELCRPLISLRAGFDLLLDDAARPIADDQRGHVQTMATLCDELLHLTRSYLDYAGLIQGARPLCYGSFTLGALICDIERQFADMADARRIRWRCTLEGPDMTVTTDASRCQQIFGNIVTNALKYTPIGGEVSTQARRAGDTWIVTVSDNGLGIPTEAIERVFAPFYRLPRDERSRVEGNGLGLAICREMVGQLGGQIALESEPGRGTRVIVRFPLNPTGEASATEPGKGPG